MISLVPLVAAAVCGAGTLWFSWRVNEAAPRGSALDRRSAASNQPEGRTTRSGTGPAFWKKHNEESENSTRKHSDNFIQST